MNKCIIQYVKNRRGEVKGLFLGFAHTHNGKDCFSFGYSLCNPKDTFDMKTAVNICFNRASSFGHSEIAPSIQEDFHNFFIRCKSYFKNRVIVGGFDTNKYTIFDLMGDLPKEFKNKWFSDKPREKNKQPLIEYYCENLDIIQSSPNFYFSTKFNEGLSISTLESKKDFTFKCCSRVKPKSGKYIKLTVDIVNE